MERIHGFDALRAIAMWLGVVLHSIIVYKETPEINWPHDSAVGWLFLDWLYEYIHIFRMPLFFLVAGFFARMVITRSGHRVFIAKRFKRIIIPFLFGVVILVPLSLFPFHFNNYFHNQRLDLVQAIKMSSLQLFKWNGLLHLWFLYYLIFFYIFSLLFDFISGTEHNVSKWISNYLNIISLTKVVVLTFILFLLLFLFGVKVPPVYTGIKPNLLYILYYGFFYVLGWLLQINLKGFTSLDKYSWALIAGGTILSIFTFYFSFSFFPLVIFLSALQTVLLVIGLACFFVTYFKSESRIWKYFSDSAYWVYLVHLFFVVSFQVLFINSSVPPVIRLPLVLILTFIATLLSYRYLVRYTVVGKYLHGERIKS